MKHICENYETNQSTNASKFLFILPVFIGEIIYLHICEGVSKGIGLGGGGEYRSMSVSNLGRVTKRKEEEPGSGENIPDLIPFIKLACCGA